ncbi:MAG: YggS family pyridoxal phosphate-dependent enzyme [Tannerellaceae bacterium]|jgi:pyridoxal phosphate enzyme (YggS family)|nr:YggS family pyridoxal phosphate-dependent enzyme [Tannerellaceae bacterium]
MNIADNITFLKNNLPPNVKLVAVSKFHPSEKIMAAYLAGQRIFGESRAQELIAKRPQLPDDIEWHFIGPLQSNKVKDIASCVHTIHSVDSPKLLQEINRQAAKHGRTINILLEIHIAKEMGKHGFTPDDCKHFLQTNSLEQFPNIRIRGLMGIATFTEDITVVKNEFRSLHSLWIELKSLFFQSSADFSELSMGMTNDYEIAVAEGSTMVRIGSFIFGNRE